MTTTTSTSTLPAFLYDDCCPLCRGYTATFAGLGWTGRHPFSSIDDTVCARLDFDRARHHIPLYDPTSGEVRYGLDGIFGVVGEQLPWARPVLAHRVVRRPFEGLYWFITYNRRHIVSAPPPVSGVNCAPDYAPAPIAAYLAWSTVTATALALAGGTAVPVVAAATGAATVARRRRPGWRVQPAEAAGHVGSVAVAAAAAGAVAGVLGASSAVAGTVALAVGARKTWLRRWMMRDPEGAVLRCGAFG